MMFFNSRERNLWLVMDDDSLFKICRHEFYKAQGRGGQKRNKTSNAIRLTFAPLPEIIATDCSGRSQHDNRKNALNKLRYEIALKVRSEDPPDVPSEVSKSNKKYPMWIALVFDKLEQYKFDIKLAAEDIGISRTKLTKLMARDSNLWQFMNQCRIKRELPPLKQ